MLDVLLVGFGAVGVMCESMDAKESRHGTQLPPPMADSFIMQRSGQARVTVVCRSNYQAVVGELAKSAPTAPTPMTWKTPGLRSAVGSMGTLPGGDPSVVRGDRLIGSRVADWTIVSKVFNGVSAALDRPYAFVVIATKALPTVSPNSAMLAPLLDPAYPHPQPTYVLMQNGLCVERDLYEAACKLNLGEPRIIIASLYIMTNINNDHVVEHGDYEKIVIGIHRADPTPRTHNTRDEEKTLQQFASLIQGARSEIDVVPEIQAIKFSKNVWNAVFSSCATLTRSPLPHFFRDPAVEAQTLPVIRAMFLEVVAVGRAMGYDESVIPDEAVNAAIEGTAMVNKRADSRHRPSMLLDLERGQPLELDVILGELVARARQLNVEIPRIETMHALLSVLQGQLLSKGEVEPPANLPVGE